MSISNSGMYFLTNLKFRSRNFMIKSQAAQEIRCNVSHQIKKSLNWINREERQPIWISKEMKIRDLYTRTLLLAHRLQKTLKIAINVSDARMENYNNLQIIMSVKYIKLKRSPLFQLMMKSKAVSLFLLF